MLANYDPHMQPDPKLWLLMDESERLFLVKEYHQESDIEVPNMMLHCAFHLTVENQIAMGEELPVERKLKQLLGEGLDRHEAIHAIGSVLAEHIYHMLHDKRSSKDPNEEYFKELASLNAQSWISSYEDLE
ncbi:MAG TPA: DUF1841 family protein [Anaerolineae bacterium]|nr:DUF1841 family protein [Anaerolineae bacterium]